MPELTTDNFFRIFKHVCPQCMSDAIDSGGRCCCCGEQVFEVESDPEAEERVSEFWSEAM